MKLAALVVTSAIVLNGCAHAPRLSCDEECALEGMVCAGMTREHGRGFATNGRGLNIGSNHHSQSITCAKPANKSQAREVENYREIASDKLNTPQTLFGISKPKKHKEKPEAATPAEPSTGL